MRIKYTILALVLALMMTDVFSSSAQDNDEFGLRLSAIRSQLDLLSDSLTLGLNESADLSANGIALQSFLRTLAESHNLNIQVSPEIDVILSNNFTNVLVKDVILFLCEEYQLDIRFTNTILSFNRFKPSPKIIPVTYRKRFEVYYNAETDKLTLDLDNDSLSLVVKQITRLSSRNLLVSNTSDLSSRLVSGFLKDVPYESALDKFAYVNGLRVVKSKDGVYIIESQQPTQPTAQQGFSNQRPASLPKRFGNEGIQVKDSLISLDIVNYSIADIISNVSSELGVNHILFSEITGNTTVRLKDIKFEEMLSLLFQGTSYTFKRRDGVYLIGQRNQEGFKSTELIKLDFRAIEGVEKDIPSDLLKDMEIKVLKELNSFVLTGSQQKIDEITSFLNLIDKPIPNIMIEVIVADARKGFNIETGIQAFLADSVPKTNGKILGGVDLTLSSSSINNALAKIDPKGVINLGKVTPQFYVTLKALEENNNIQIRSTPKLSTMNGNKANLVIGQSVYYLEQTQNITGGVNPITTTAQRFNKVEANLSITISPAVSGNEHITLDISAEFSNFLPPTIQNAPPGNTTRKFESKIRIRNEEMIILGGLEELTKSESASGVPWISRIPVLKWFFSTKSKRSQDDRLIVFIKPTLVY